MGRNNGKFFDAKETSSYFSDIETEFNSFNTSVIPHQQSQNRLATQWCLTLEKTNKQNKFFVKF